ncbi:MAG: hypothetical protein RIS47_1789, partial [Bacteroidota bacterium]
MSNIVVCLPNQDLSSVSESLVQLSDNQNISLVLLSQVASDLPKSELFDFSGFLGLDFLQRLAARIKGADYLLLGLKDARLILGQFAEDRLLSVAEDSGAVMVYSDYTEIREGKASARPLIDYQLGSIRDDFAFGALVMLRADLFRKVVIELETEYEFAAFYDVRLKLSRMGAFYRLPEFLYTVDESDLRASGQKLFDYVDPKNRAVQLEMEAAATAHLKTLGAWLSPEFLPVVFDEEAFSVRASVIIPVRNRAKTIGDAVASVLSQLADFEFNCIVVDNHSTDGTSDILADFARRDSRLIHVQPSRTDLGIGGCWNVGVADSR